MGKSKTRKEPTKTEQAIALEAGRELYAYIRANKNNLPDYWHDKGAPVCIDGIRCMIARGKTDEEIAEFYECHVSIVEQVRIAHEKTINRYKKEHDEMIETFGEKYENTTFENADQEGVLRLLEFIVEGRKHEN